MTGALTKIAGWIVGGFGAVHLVIAPLDTRDTWDQVAGEGWWNAFTLDRATTFDELRRSEAFWVTAGSFGVPLLALGSAVAGLLVILGDRGRRSMVTERPDPPVAHPEFHE